jgi:hypothetical protein
MTDEWRKDFWVFVDVVGDRPDGHTLRKKDQSLPMGPDNWYWKKSEDSSDRAKYARKHRRNNSRKTKSAELKRSFGITIDEYEAMLEEQNGVCAICSKPEVAIGANGGPQMLAVDHCHETSRIRGLLCGNCNKALGGFRDSKDILESAIRYLGSSGAA